MTTTKTNNTNTWLLNKKPGNLRKHSFLKTLFRGLPLLVVFALFLLPVSVYAVPDVSVSVGITDDPQQIATSVQLLFLFAIIALAPTLLMMVTCFPRILICFHFIRTAMATQQTPPNQILVALALFMTFAIMGGTFREINAEALQPLSRGEITTEAAFARGMQPIREFMFRQVEDVDLALFWRISGRGEVYDGVEEIPNEVLIPAFILGEISKGFMFGVLIYIPFICIDMIVATILMAMGMMMLPPAMISMPFKLLLFVSVGGWNLTVGRIFDSFG